MPPGRSFPPIIQNLADAVDSIQTVMPGAALTNEDEPPPSMPLRTQPILELYKPHRLAMQYCGGQTTPWTHREQARRDTDAQA